MTNESIKIEKWNQKLPLNQKDVCFENLYQLHIKVTSTNALVAMVDNHVLQTPKPNHSILQYKERDCVDPLLDDLLEVKTKQTLASNI